MVKVGGNNSNAPTNKFVGGTRGCHVGSGYHGLTSSDHGVGRVGLSPAGLPGSASNGGATNPAAEEPLRVRHSAFAESLLGDGEIILLELKPSLWFVILVSAPVAGFGLLLVLAGKLAWVEEHVPQVGRWLVIIGGILLVARLVWGVLQWMSRVYVLTDRRVIRQKGVLTRQVFECRLNKIQNTFVGYTVTQRLMGIGTIGFATAGTRAVEASWQHISGVEEVNREIQRAISRYGR